MRTNARSWMVFATVGLPLAVAASLLGTGAARADVVPREPICLPGETARASHRGTWCEPAPPREGCPLGSEWRSTQRSDAACYAVSECTCKDPAGCPDCQPVSLCVEDVRHDGAGRQSAESWIEQRVHGYCGPGCGCAPPSRCVTATRNVAPPKPGEPPRSLVCSATAGASGPGAARRGGCGGCAVPSDGGSEVPIVGLAVFGWVVARRLRRRSVAPVGEPAAPGPSRCPRGFDTLGR